MEITGSPFDLGRDLQQASFSDYKGDLYLSGGFDIVSNNHPYMGVVELKGVLALLQGGAL